MHGCTLMSHFDQTLPPPSTSKHTHSISELRLNYSVGHLFGHIYTLWSSSMVKQLSIFLPSDSSLAIALNGQKEKRIHCCSSTFSAIDHLAITHCRKTHTHTRVHYHSKFGHARRQHISERPMRRRHSAEPFAMKVITYERTRPCVRCVCATNALVWSFVSHTAANTDRGNPYNHSALALYTRQHQQQQYRATSSSLMHLLGQSFVRLLWAFTQEGRFHF